MNQRAHGEAAGVGADLAESSAPGSGAVVEEIDAVGKVVIGSDEAILNYYNQNKF
ncbi:MAG TPA: hypothetical protein PLL06_09890 [Acidobacteriota bacterium]|nr:hypothetical protein [Acidobacteriota bacterium]HNB73431.1 hypothetical protein [Acidobacteriota bacterium]